MADSIETVSEAAVNEARRPPRGRIWLLLILGVAIICGALVFRSSAWAKEYPLKRASLEVLRSWAERSPRDPLVQYYLGVKSYDNGLYPEAVLAFRAATTQDPKMTRAFLGLAGAHRVLGQNPEAYAAAKQAALLEPKNVPAQFLIASLVAEVSLQDARPEYQKLTRLAPERADAWYGLGMCEAGLIQRGDAVAPLTKAVELDPKNALYRRDLGQILMRLSRFEEARPHLEEAVRLGPEDASSWYYAGKTLGTLAKTDAELTTADEHLQRAIQLLEAAEERSPVGEAEIKSVRAELMRRLNRLADAEKLLREARLQDPKTVNYLRQLADVVRARGNQQLAVELMREYAAKHELEEAVEQMKQRLKQDPNNPGQRLRFARLLVQAGDIPQAYTQYTIVHKLKPQQPAEVRAEFKKVEEDFKALQKVSVVAPAAAK
ncbi:MAG: tetratricopeptide repeat protein [Armatimonadota bacterium]